MSDLKGFTVPRTPEGRSSLVPYPPWHYVGAFLVIDGTVTAGNGTVALTAAHANDRVGAAFFSDGLGRMVPPKKGRRQEPWLREAHAGEREDHREGNRRGGGRWSIAGDRTRIVSNRSPTEQKVGVPP